ncbi:MAG: hypothetical protein H0V17_21170 [Deltaproteobacteria bacterium]|nr:hypothetical protein [Deltaproteobacteria bacterium]
MKSWARRTAELHGELRAIAEPDVMWWLLAGGVAAVELRGAEGAYVLSDATPPGDTFIGYRDPRPITIDDAIARARAAATALRELDGQLPGQPLCVTLGNPAPTSAHGAVTVKSQLDVAAFAIGDRCVIGKLDDPQLREQLAAAVSGASPPPWHGSTPFVCVSIGDDKLETCRHAHRRAWRNGAGPWLGLGRASDGTQGALATITTCHLVVDGYGHARIAGRIAELMARAPASTTPSLPLPALCAVEGGIPLGVVWRELPHPSPRVLPLGYALGRVLHQMAGHRDAKFSPTFQIPIAPGDRDDPMRNRRRAAASILSVRFEDGQPEPFDVFATRARAILSREASGHGLWTRSVAAARGMPGPLAWKRRSIGTSRARWLDRFAEVIGGRACLSKIAVDTPLPASCAVSSPARLATPRDPLGSCVLTILEDSSRSAITACGSGIAGTSAAADHLLDELLMLVSASEPREAAI